MLFLFFVIVAVLIIIASFKFTKDNKKNRVITGIVIIIFSILSYPVLVPIVGELMSSTSADHLGSIASLMVFNLMLLLGGLITFIAGLFTETIINNEDQKDNHF